MKIGYVHSTDFPSLDANVVQVVQMCRAFAGLGHDVVLFIPQSAAYPSAAAGLDAARMMYGGDLPFTIQFVPRIRIAGRLEMLGTVRGTLRALRDHPLDLIYSRNPWTVAFLPRAGMPYVFEAHEERVHNRSRLLERFLRSTIVRNSRRTSCALVVTISAALRDIWRGYGVPDAKLLAAHDGVELELFDPDLSRAAARALLAAQYPDAPLSSARPLVVYTGALKQDRGIDLMLAAARQLPELEFLIVGGKDDELAQWRTAASQAQLANVRFPGRVPHREIPHWLAAADILLMMWTWAVPTIRGCSPMKMFEYMAANRLIVGPAFPTVQEVLTDGRDAILFEPDKLDALVAALRRAAALSAGSIMPGAARQLVARDYTWQARCRRILDGLAQRGIA